MDNKYNEKLLIIQATIESDSQQDDDKQMKTDEKLTEITEHLTVLTSNITSLMDQTNNQKFSPSQKDTSNPPDPTTMVLDKSRDTPLDMGNSTKYFGVWTLKHDIKSPKFYELLINTELK